MLASSPTTTTEDTPGDLIRTQIEFGIAYAREARAARRSGKTEYAAAAREIALRSHATAVRFISRFGESTNLSVRAKMLAFERELKRLNARERLGSQAIA